MLLSKVLLTVYLHESNFMWVATAREYSISDCFCWSLLDYRFTQYESVSGELTAAIDYGKNYRLKMFSSSLVLQGYQQLSNLKCLSASKTECFTLESSFPTANHYLWHHHSILLPTSADRAFHAIANQQGAALQQLTHTAWRLLPEPPLSTTLDSQVSTSFYHRTVIIVNSEVVLLKQSTILV